ncbi:MAG: late competence development ComFB family protein [Rhizobacter sp.]|nr:late competence development ComFB family protein [Rhizobacter sp.]
MGTGFGIEFDLIHNHHEKAVLYAVKTHASAHPQLPEELLADIACVALNRLPPRYIRHDVDFAFFLSDKERAETQDAIDEAVGFAFEFVRARAAVRARA